VVDAAILLKDTVAVPLLYGCYKAAEWGAPTVPSLMTLPPRCLSSACSGAGRSALARLAMTCRDLESAVRSCGGGVGGALP